MAGPQYEGGQILNPAEVQHALGPGGGPLAIGLTTPGTAPPKSPLEREMLATTPQPDFLQRLKTYGPGLLGALATMGLPGRLQARPLAGPLARTGLGALTAGGAAAATGGSFKEEATRFLGTQAPAEAGFGVVRVGRGQRLAGKALKQAATDFTAAQKQHELATEQADLAYQAALKQHEADVTKLKTTYAESVKHREATITKNQETFTRHQAEYANKTAGSIVKAWQQDVPAFREFPENERGIVDIVAGQGPVRLSEHYDASMKALIPEARGKEVPLSIEHGDSLGLKPTGVISAEGGRPTHAYYPADQVAEKTVGTGKKNPQRYHEVFDALDKIGLGNVQARGEYKSGMALIEFGAKGDIVKKGYFDPEAARLALFDPKEVGALRSRQQGDVFRGPVAEAVQRPDLRTPTGPLATPEPPVVPKPTLPHPPEKPSPLKKPVKPDTGITKHNVPIGVIPGLVGGYGAGAATGIPHLGWVGAMAGAEAGRRFGPNLPTYTGGPSASPTPPMLPSTIAEMLRLYFTQKAQPPTP